MPYRDSNARMKQLNSTLTTSGLDSGLHALGSSKGGAATAALGTCLIAARHTDLNPTFAAVLALVAPTRIGTEAWTEAFL